MKKMPLDELKLLRDYTVQRNGSATTLSYESVASGKLTDWGVCMKLPMDWTCQDTCVRDYKFRVNALLHLNDAYVRFLKEEEEKYAKLILAHISDFAIQNPIFEESDEWQWHDDATAIRLRRMAVMYYDCARFAARDAQEVIEDAMRKHAELLATEIFYKKKHNHGMHQDVALLIYEYLYGEGEESDQRLKIAKKRLSEYFSYVYTKDGVYKEHTILYANDMMREICFLYDFFINYDFKFANKIKRWLDMSKRWLLSMIKPNGMWPPLGDGREQNGLLSMKNYMNDDLEYTWFITRGNNGRKPDEDVVFKDGGYAVFRSDCRTQQKNAVWMSLIAASHSSTHKHGDDLEVLLYCNGDIFVEGGGEETIITMRKNANGHIRDMHIMC